MNLPAMRPPASVSLARCSARTMHAMNLDTRRPSLHVTTLSLGAGAAARLSGWSAICPAGLSLIVDEEGDLKTGLLRVLAGETAADAGTVRWNDADNRAWPPAQYKDALFWRDPRAPWPELSPAHWAQDLAARHPRWSAADWQAHGQGLGLTEHLHKEMFRLSAGSRRKVLLAAALASGAPLTLIDEPEAALDWASIRYLRAAWADEAARSAKTGRVIVVAHHEPMPGVPWAQVLRLP